MCICVQRPLSTQLNFPKTELTWWQSLSAVTWRASWSFSSLPHKSLTYLHTHTYTHWNLNNHCLFSIEVPVNLITRELKIILSLHDSTVLHFSCGTAPQRLVRCGHLCGGAGETTSTISMSCTVSEAGATILILGPNVLTAFGRNTTGSPNSTLSGNSQTQQ